MGRFWRLLLGRLCSSIARIRFRAKSPPAIVPNDFSVRVARKDGRIISSSSDARRVMVVVDSSPEAKIALHWALSHTVQGHDILVLLHIIKPPKQSFDHQIGYSPKVYELLSAMTNICNVRKPQVKVEVALLEISNMKKGAAIVEAVKEQGITLLVLGRRRPISRRLARAFATGKTVQYCIEKADCMTIAVRKKSRKVGGFLISTKRHKEFWLLA